jgi:hypothetical protein
MKEAIILFHSTNQAMWAADILKEKKISHKMVPVPRHLSSDCGYCIQFAESEKNVVETALIENNVEFDKIEDL